MIHTHTYTHMVVLSRFRDLDIIVRQELHIQ